MIIKYFYFLCVLLLTTFIQKSWMLPTTTMIKNMNRYSRYKIIDLARPMKKENEIHEIHESVSETWKSRRNIARLVITAAGLTTTTNKTSNTDIKDTTKNSLWFGALLTVILAIGIRMGGRFTVLQLVGLDLEHDISLREKIHSFLEAVATSSNEQVYAILFFAWFVAKALCIDFLTVVLAISSGIFFNNLTTAATISVLSSSISSLMIFLSTRWFCGESVINDISKRPFLRALDRSVKKSGFKTVFSLRISPLLPIPIGAYNYLYALSSLSPVDFFLGISIGSIKPYLLDAYLGSTVRDIFLESTGSDLSTFTSTGSLSEFSSTTPWWVPTIIVATILLVSTFAAELFTSTYKEIEDELKLLTNTTADGKIDAFSALGINENDLPSYLRSAKNLVDSSWTRIEAVIADEWKVYTSEKMINEPMKLIEVPSTASLPSYANYEYEEVDFKNWKRDLIESSIFLFVLLNFLAQTNKKLN